MRSRPSWHAFVLLLRPRRVLDHLARLAEQGRLPARPNLWQIELGVLRMWHRVLFRSETVGTCSDPVRPTLRARVLRFRPLRFPWLVRERAIAPLDHSGLVQSATRLTGHLITAHHDATDFAYDLEILAGTPGALEAARVRVAGVVDGTHPKAEWYRDLCVYEGYHERLLAALDVALAGRPVLSEAERDDPDLSFSGFVRWCAAQPLTPAATWSAWRAGAFPAVPS